MLVVKVEIWPGGDGDRAETLGVAALANISAMAETSDYAVVVTDARGHDLEFRLTDHWREAGIWPLVASAARVAADAATFSVLNRRGRAVVNGRRVRASLPRMRTGRVADEATFDAARELLDRFAVRSGARVDNTPVRRR